MSQKGHCRTDILMRVMQFLHGTGMSSAEMLSVAGQVMETLGDDITMQEAMALTEKLADALEATRTEQVCDWPPMHYTPMRVEVVR